MFPKIGIPPKMDGENSGNIPLKFMIWGGFPLFLVDTHMFFDWNFWLKVCLAKVECALVQMDEFSVSLGKYSSRKGPHDLGHTER